ncbi:MAG: CocE/NonD family hydrolase [Armatimonadota bacterium]|nr:MAG: CocE/NonD family hydrolase [Armatimonadota bacterium]
MTRGPRFRAAAPRLAAAAFACLLVLPRASARQVSDVRTYMVPMRDGVRLATDVRLPDGSGPWAAVLMRTPYGRSRTAGGLEHYAIVCQDVRGRGDSEGCARPFFDDGWGEHQDGFDTVTWILAQPWCNGKIGTLGPSALGITQSLLAGTDPPGVLCQHISVACGSLYHHMAYPGGTFRQALVAGWLEEAAWPADNLGLIFNHPAYDELWRTVDSVACVAQERVTIPAVHIGGWFDIFAQGTIDSFVSRSRVAPNQWMIIGPWAHAIKREIGEFAFPSNAIELPPLADPEQRPLWFDFWLAGKDTGLRGIPRVHYYVMGACDEEGAPGNQWRTADSWPVAAQPTRFFLAPAGELVRQAPTTTSTATYDYDPADPVPTRGGGNLLIPAGPMDQREVEQRPDVLSFTTATLTYPVEVTGQVTVQLWASSSARDTAFTAKLCDVYPDGRSMLLCDGALRAACRESFSELSPIEPGEMYEFNIDVGSTSIIFNQGHRIRVAISSSNYPRFATHPNVWGEGAPQVAHQTIYFGGDHPSAVILPIVAITE